MKQKLRLFSTLLLLAVVSAAWGEEATSSWPCSSTPLSTEGTTLNGINWKISASNTYSNPIRFYSGTTMTLTADPEVVDHITKVVFTASSTGNYVTVLQDATAKLDGTKITPTVSSKDVTWTAGTTEKPMEFTITVSAQTRLSSMVVYYEKKAGAVEKADPEIAFSETSVTINDGEALPAITFLNPHSVSVNFTSSNQNVATVDESGVISLVEGGIGTSVITATSVENDEYVSAKTTCTIRVNDPRQTPTLEWQDANGEKVTAMTIYEGDAFTAPTVSYDGDGAKTFASSDVSVATIDDSGTVTIKGVGSTEISVSTAKTDNYKAATAKYTLSVVEKVVGDTYELVTDASTLAADDKIIITNADGTFALSTTQNSNNRGQEAVVAKDNKIVLGQETKVQVLTLEGNADGWYFNTGSGYLYAASSSSNHLKTEADADDNAKATISIANGEATITFQGTNTRNLLKYNSNSSVFSCYASGQSAVSIYKLAVVDERQEAGLAFSQESVTVNLGETATVTLSKETNADVEITYSVEGVATYDVATGVITPLKAGTTEVTATAAENDDYKAGSAVLTIKVIDPNASEAMFDFDNDYKTLFPMLPGVSSGSGAEYVSAGDINEDLTATVDGVALTVSAGVHVEGETYFNPNRIWNKSPRLRMYSGTLTVAAPAGYEITEMEFQGNWNNGNTANVGTLSSSGWTGNAETVVITIAGNTQFKSINVKYTVKAAPETITVNINKNASDASGMCYGTLYYSNLNLVVPTGLTAYTYKVTDGTLTESKTYAIGEVIPAGTAVVVKTSAALTENTDYDFAVTTEVGVADADNMLHGTDKAATTYAGEGDWKYYKLTTKNGSNLGFYFGVDGGASFTNGAHKAYLAVPAGQAPAKGFVLGEETTGINAIDNSQQAVESIYNLSGQRVQKATKGVYIVNGKKVVIR